MPFQPYRTSAFRVGTSAPRWSAGATRETEAEEKKEGQVEKASSKEAYGDLSVTDLKMVSETCTK